MQQSVTVGSSDELNSTIRRINNTINQGVQWFLWLKPTTTSRLYTLDTKTIIDRTDVTIQSESTTCVIVGSFIVTNGSSLTLINVDTISNTAFYIDNSAMVNVSESNVYSIHRVCNGYGRISLINCNVIGRMGFKHCQVYVNKGSLYFNSIVFDRVSGELVDTIVTVVNIRDHTYRSNVILSNSTVVSLSELKIPQVVYRPRGTVRKDLLPWVNNKGKPGWIKGDLVDGGRYQIWLAYINTKDPKVAMETKGYNNQPPDDIVPMNNSMLGIWVEVLNNTLGSIRWSRYELSECVGNNLGNFESKLDGIDKESVDQRYWIAIAKKIPGLNNRPPDKVKIVNNKYVVGVWTVATDLCPVIQWAILSNYSDYIIGYIHGSIDNAYKLPYNGKLPDHVTVIDDITYGIWINGNVPLDTILSKLPYIR